MKLFKIIAVFIFITQLMSCANINTVVKAPATTGVSQIFKGDHEMIKAAVLASVQGLNVNIKGTSESPDGFNITFTKAISAFSWGEVGRVLVVKNDSNSSKVFVHSEKRSKYQITGSDSYDFANSIFSGTREILKNR